MYYFINIILLIIVFCILFSCIRQKKVEKAVRHMTCSEKCRLISKGFPKCPHDPDDRLQPLLSFQRLSPGGDGTANDNFPKNQNLYFTVLKHYYAEDKKGQNPLCKQRYPVPSNTVGKSIATGLSGGYAFSEF